MPLNFPIVLTWLRIAMIPLLVALFYVPHDWLPTPTRDTIAALAFIFAALTDWFDGWLARRWNQTSSFGAFLDPVADKLMVCTALLILLDLNRVDAVIALVIIGREITISALREWMAKIGASGSVAVHWLGKFKTGAQMVAIPCLLYWQALFGVSSVWIGHVLIFVAAVLTIWSMCYYLRRAMPQIRDRAGRDVQPH
ncbi:CDP-diacylglycerol--glycerol-3-phosphate 3-phosphatidyltransferase [Pusillimonas sp.]|uniref:CDP-diacylglycerol--glycerol-3-phosphate 3-phosphatidyltransferase n=1 Tax=Pusillimonas sp. TaxID=3040095 RepID=UPI0029A522BF|nr:CDP-diacylglycerol--glycerol-3-phosphate 3-phosphatidyltransferase [Pusillimonas sp.]MDX3894809.1 CDP-diacylglycerol--glycerol-3-phosphate 3-phosphatidyltransferase [Pusillimonas sp.]